MGQLHPQAEREMVKLEGKENLIVASVLRWPLSSIIQGPEAVTAG